MCTQALRSYGSFLEHVRNDPREAQRYFREADKQEELQADQRLRGLGK